MEVFLFPGQGAQFTSMGLELYRSSAKAKSLFKEANNILGYDINEIMFEGTEEELAQTRVTQPAIFIHSVITAKILGVDKTPAMMAGHSLGEFSALTVAGALSFEDGLTLVKERALAMQDACDMTEGTMAAILGLADEKIEMICKSIDDIVVPANYNSPGQLVISGSIEGINLAVEELKKAGAKRAIILKVGGAFHSPLMQPAEDHLADSIEEVEFLAPQVPVYQNVTGLPETDPEIIKENLLSQLTAPVMWTQTMLEMIKNGGKQFYEIGGKGGILQGLLKKVDRSIETYSL
ncbi:ACP S-malonyltransferase [Membranihabitans marinus]|uniref:ACP S-malonyltransferase n=1 Tax=Membranihabitans marinus TaxID=1227546 RepID=UPI001F02A795|nr:ACP S-malonyltransferase [Membranihabitans marinus]